MKGGSFANTEVIDINPDHVFDLKDLRENTQQTADSKSRTQGWLFKFRLSAHYKYVVVFEKNGATEETYNYNLSVHDLNSNDLIHEFSLKGMQDAGKYSLVDVEAHPTIDELFLVYDTGGWVKIFDIVTA